MGNRCPKLCRGCPMLEEYKDSSRDSENMSSKGKIRQKNKPEKKQRLVQPVPITGPEPRVRGSLMRKMSANDHLTIETALSTHFILKNLTAENKKFVISSMKQVVIGGQEVVFSQGDSGDLFYVVLAGRCEVIINNVRKAVLNPGTTFGELALLDHGPRTATIKTLERCVLWAIDQHTFKKAIEEISASNYDNNRKMIENVTLFSDFTEDQKDRLISVLTTQDWSEGSEIVKEGDPGDQFYIISKGRVACYQKGEKIREMGEFEYFGERALLEHCFRTATVVALEEVSLTSLSKKQAEAALGQSLETLIYENSIKNSIENSKYLNFLTKEQVGKIVKATQIVKYASGEIIIPDRQVKGHKLCIIIQGSVLYEKKTLKKLRCIGDQAIVKQSNVYHKRDVVAQEDCVIGECLRESMECSLNKWLKNLRTMNRIIKILRKISIFRMIPKDRLEEIASVVNIQRFAQGDIIVKENTPADCLFIVKKGNVKIIKKKTTVRSIGENDFFGERSILMNELRTATAVADGEAICWSLQKDVFLKVIDDNARELMKKRMILQDDSITLDDLLPIKKLGEGSFGTVILASHRTKHVLYAVKCMNMEIIKKYDLYENVIIEKNIMIKMDHPMIMKMVKLLKDSKRIYIVGEYVQGMDLFEVLNRLDTLSEPNSKFYSAGLVIILTYLHKQSIVYRDLKPENVMVDEDGYMKLIDFGTAKEIKGRTYTTVGTPHYMAPEVILAKGYSLSADLWSLGVMIYEFIYSNLPFGADAGDIQAVYRSVLEEKLNFPKTPAISTHAQSMIRQLLNKEAYLRCQGTTETLMNHAWFQDVSWNDFILRNLKAPFIPEMNKTAANIERALKTPHKFIEFIDSIEDMRSRNKKKH